MTMCIPDLNGNAKNFNFLNPLTKGCQFGMCFQNNDPQINAYHDFFSKEARLLLKSVLGIDLLKVNKCLKYQRSHQII